MAMRTLLVAPLLAAPDYESAEGLRDGAVLWTNPAADSTWREHLAHLAGGSGIWLTSNDRYRTDANGEPPHYGMRYWMGPGGMTQHGCLWGQGPGEPRPVFWSFFTAWDPTRRQLLVYQSSPYGVVGIGHEAPDTRIAEQTFTAPDGTSWEVRHVTLFTPPDSLDTRSFQRSKDGVWEPRRTYRWVRQPVGTEAPC
jgi:hypothetical protein